MHRWNLFRQRSKTKAERRHAIRRFAQRFPKELTNHEYDELVRQIQSGRAKFIEKQSNRVSVFEVKTSGITAIAIYDKSRKTIITFITPEMAAEEGNGPIKLD
jgi:hypothetical protein